GPRSWQSKERPYAARHPLRAACLRSSPSTAVPGCQFSAVAGRSASAARRSLRARLSARLRLTRIRQRRYWVRLPGPKPAPRPALRNTSSLTISLSFFSSASFGCRPIKVDSSGSPYVSLFGTHSSDCQNLRDISHYSPALVHTYVQPRSSFLKLPILEEIWSALWKLINRALDQ